MKTTFICIVNEKGKVIKELDSASTTEAIHSFISGTGLKIEKIGLESGCLTHYLKKGLKKLGYEGVGMESHKMAAILGTIINKIAEALSRVLILTVFPFFSLDKIICKSILFFFMIRK